MGNRQARNSNEAPDQAHGDVNQSDSEDLLNVQCTTSAGGREDTSKESEDEGITIADNSLVESSSEVETSSPVQFNVVLNGNTEVTARKEVEFPKLPATGFEVKEIIEKVLKIPVCMQKLHFESQEIKDMQNLTCLHLRDGDTIGVEFSSRASTDDISDILKQMRIIDRLLVSSQLEFTSAAPLSDNTDTQVQIIVKPAAVESLVCKFFSPSTAEHSKANRLYFVSNGGIKLTLSLHVHLLSIPWDRLTIEMQFLEHALLRILWDLSSTLGVRCLLLQHRVVELVSQSMLRQRVHPYQHISVSQCQRASSHQPAENILKYILGETMFKAMGVVANLAELPQCRTAIVRYPGVIEQMASAILSPSYSIICAEIVLSSFLCLSYSPDTHRHLAQPHILHGVLESCKRFSREYNNPPRFPQRKTAVEHQDLILVEYFAVMFIAMLTTSSPALMVESYYHSFSDVLRFVNRFLQNVTHQEIHEAEVKTNYFWSTFKPFVNLTYFQYTKKTTSNKLVQEHPLLGELYIHSMRAGIFSLKNVCLSNNCKEVLEKEKLVDFITCLPWYVPAELKEDAQSLVRTMNGVVFPGPPRLTNIIKAMIAASTVSLDTVMAASFITDVHNLT